MNVLFDYNNETPMTQGEIRRKWLLWLNKKKEPHTKSVFVLGTENNELIAFGDTLILVDNQSHSLVTP